MKSMRTQVDYRETALRAELEALGFQYETRNLPVGDVAFLADADDDTDGGGYVLFCERKTYSDLNSSIPDGRFRDQRARLQESGVQFIYLLEGPKRVFY